MSRAFRYFPVFTLLILCAPAEATAPAASGVIDVSHCGDSGPGSLRNAVAAASTGDVINLNTVFNCSRIVLTSGEIVVTQSQLTIQGPGPSFTIDAGKRSRIFNHPSSQGTLNLSGLTLTNGFVQLNDASAAKGGCIYSGGTVRLVNVTVAVCEANNLAIASQGAFGGAIFAGYVAVTDSVVRNSRAYAASGSAYGGGIYASSFLTFDGGSVSGNLAQGTYVQEGPSNGSSYGGGVYAGRGLFAAAATFDANVASGHFGSGGGLYVVSDAQIERSTISNNQADLGGGAVLGGPLATTDISIDNSTISSNRASADAGLFIHDRAGRIRNSTIADNACPQTEACKGIGLVVSNAAVDLQSTLIVRNSTSDGLVWRDVGAENGGVLTGANNLINSTAGVPLPGDTLTGNPDLGELADNGGLTKTQRLGRQSAALDRGNVASGRTTDQRGYGHARIVGAGPDIGAFELEPERIFANGFEN